MPLKSALPPSHPGKMIKDICIEGEGLTITESAKNLGVSRVYLSKILNGRASISPEMAVKIAKAFGSTPEMWLRMQSTYDLYYAKKNVKTDEIQSFHSSSAAA